MIEEAKPWSVDGSNGRGALCLHGFGGHPAEMRAVAEAYHRAGFAVELPLLPGHGTMVDEMIPTRWTDWCAEAESAYRRLAGRVDTVVVAGLSMGAALCCWLAGRYPPIAGVVCINPVSRPLDSQVLDMARDMLADGERVIPAGRSDIADPAVTTTSYRDTPIAALLSLMDDGLARLDLGAVRSPVLLLTSRNDHVVAAADFEHFAARVAGPIERVDLPRSYHVATMDYDAELICELAIEFSLRVSVT